MPGEPKIRVVRTRIPKTCRCPKCGVKQSFRRGVWNVKSGYGGPGPNYWSDSDQNVWIDSNGWLYLKIRNVGGT